MAAALPLFSRSVRLALAAAALSALTACLPIPANRPATRSLPSPAVAALPGAAVAERSPGFGANSATFPRTSRPSRRNDGDLLAPGLPVPLPQPPSLTPATGGCSYQGRDFAPEASVMVPPGDNSLRAFGQRLAPRAGGSMAARNCQCSSSSGQWRCL